MHRRNCVEDSSDPLVCTCQTFAVLFPHLGHSMRMVGRVLSFCSSFPMTATNCFGLCSMILPVDFTSSTDSRFLNWHLVQTSISKACFPEFTFLGTRREPQSLQNSIRFTFNFFFGGKNHWLICKQTRSVIQEERGEFSLELACLLTVDSSNASGLVLSDALLLSNRASWKIKEDVTVNIQQQMCFKSGRC